MTVSNGPVMRRKRAQRRYAMQRHEFLRSRRRRTDWGQAMAAFEHQEEERRHSFVRSLIDLLMYVPRRT